MLVHGAEGTDTTLLVTALAQVILDPGCRTMVGFQGLLEREWIEVRAAEARLGTPGCLHPCYLPRFFGVPQAGHPFHLRCARSAYSHARLKQEAPLFLLFLDCVWQLSRQFPFSLEFGESLLLALFDNAYASDYGTFLCNNEKERRVLGGGDGSAPEEQCHGHLPAPGQSQTLSVTPGVSPSPVPRGLRRLSTLP